VHQLLLKFAYILESSPRYQNIKTFFYNLLENDNYKYKRYFDIFMIIVILSSVTLLVIDVKHHIPKYLDDFDLYFVTTVFIVEYLLRMWVYNDIHQIILEEYEEAQFFDKPLSLYKVFKKIALVKWRYMTTISAIIDLIAILPSYRGLRVLRVLVLFRAFKMLRYAKSLTGFLYVLKNKKFELITLLTLSTFFIFIAGIMLYVFEGNNENPNIKNLFDAFYWALITISTVGYGDIAPLTPEGRAVSMFIILTGIGLISFATSIIVSSFNERLSILREDRIVQELGKKSDLTIVCGYGLLGRLVVEGLVKEGIDFVIIDSSEEKAAFADTQGYRAICADASDGKIFQDLGVEKRIKNVLCLTSDDIQNAFIAINVKSLNENVHVVARCSDSHIASKMRFAKVDQVIMPEEVTGMMGAVYAGEPVAFEVLLSMVEEKDKTQIDEIKVTHDGKLQGKKVKDIDFKAYRLIFLGFFQYDDVTQKLGDFIFNPDDELIFKPKDQLICIGYTTAILNLKKEA